MPIAGITLKRLALTNVACDEKWLPVCLLVHIIHVSFTVILSITASITESTVGYELCQPVKLKG